MTPDASLPNSDPQASYLGQAQLKDIVGPGAFWPVSTPHLQCAVDISLRDFQKTDLDSLWRIDQQCFAPGISYSREELSAYTRLLGSFTIIAESAGPAGAKISGFVVARVNRRQGHIITIDVLPEARRFGVGSKLLSAAENRFQGAQCTTAKLEAAVNNTAALTFYKRHQYIVQKTIPRYYPDGVDAFVLEKNLPSAPPTSKLPS